MRYVPPEFRETRSQQDRLARADAGDLQARLELISLESAEAALDQRRCKHQPERSVLSYLQDPGDGLARYQAASSILEQLADRTEETAYDSVLVFRYIKAHELWKDHPSPDVLSAEDLVKQLDGSDYVQANIVIGTSAQAAKRNCMRMIDSSWGPGWFDKIPISIRDQSWSRAEECSKRTLIQIAANAKQGISLESAVESWTEAIQKRNDPATRREQRSKSRVTPYLTPGDIALLNGVDKGTGMGRRTCDMFFPEEAKEDTLRVELLVPSSSPKAPLPRPDYSIGSKPRATRKRKKVREEVEEEGTGGDVEAEGEDGWVKVGGRSMVKRVRKHLIRKLVDDEDDDDGGSDRGSTSAQSENETSSSQPPSTQPPSAQRTKTTSQDLVAKRRHPKCDGPAVALMFRKFIDLFDEIPSLDTDAGAESRCCDVCRPLVTAKSAYLRSELLQWAVKLEGVQVHTSDGVEIPPSQEHGISPSKKQPVPAQSPLPIHDSDSDGT